MRALWCLLLAALWCVGVQAQQVTLVFAGDTTLDDEAGEMIARGGDPLAAFAPLFAQADLRLLNLECVVATTGSAGSKNYTFRAHPRVLPVLRRHVDGVTLANNHSGDYGRAAFAEMLGLLKAAGLAQAGGGMNLELAAAGNTQVVQAKLKTIEALGLRKGIEDILITLPDQYHLIRLVPNHPGLFLYLVLDKAKGNLALARYKLTDIERALRV